MKKKIICFSLLVLIALTTLCFSGCENNQEGETSTDVAFSTEVG